MGNIGTWELDIKNNKLVWTKENYRIFGILPGVELNYEIFLNCVHPDDREYVNKKWRAALQHAPYDIVHRIVVDGRIKWVREKAELEFDKQGNCIRGIGFTQDITDRKKAEEKIKSLAKFPSEDPNPVLRVDKNSKVLYANAAGSKLLEELGCEAGLGVPGRWNRYVSAALESGSSKELEVACTGKIFSLIIAPVKSEGYVNLYGIDITERSAAEEDLRKYRRHLEELVDTRTAELTKANEQLMAQIEGRKLLEREILDISERERRRIGEELHDSLGQQLTGISFMTKVLEHKLANTAPNQVVDVVEIARLVEQATNQARSLAKGLDPVDLHADSLMSSLDELARQTRDIIGVNCVFKCDMAIEAGDASTAVHLYRIAQEAVNNAIKHGKAKNIEILLTHRQDKTVMIVTNDGLDFPEDIKSGGTGMGLQIMDHRVDLIGGELDIRTASQGGTVLTCSFNNNKNHG
jgi:PAS domain S-box-containing protein